MWKRVKISSNYLEDKEKMRICCRQNNERMFVYGIGVSPIGRVVWFVATLFYD